MQDRIERSIEVEAPLARVWKAITDHEQFGEWFQVKLEGPFAVGEVSLGQMTYPGYEGFKWEATVEVMDEERLFAFRWCPYGDRPDLEEVSQNTTLVEFRFEVIPNGTRVVVTESGFSALPDDGYRLDTLRQNSEGWEEQVQNIKSYVES